MQGKSILPFKPNMLLYPLLLVFSMWLVFWFEIRFDISFNKLGVRPRHIYGLKGVLFSPFIHVDASHLWHNTLPLFILSSALFYFYENLSIKVLLIGALFTGIATWMIGRDSYHIGASGVIYMLFGFLTLKGVLAKHLRLLAVSFFVVFVYGGMIWYVAPIDYKISWEGHLSGLLVGCFLAVSYKSRLQEEIPRYAWEMEDYDPDQDEFMKCFDENGNFIPTPPLMEFVGHELEIEQIEETVFNKDIRLIYHKIDKRRQVKKQKGKHKNSLMLY